MEGVLLRPNCGIYSGNDNGGGGRRVYGTRFSNNDHLRYYYTRSRSRYSTMGVRCGVGDCNKASVVVMDKEETITTTTTTTDDKKKRNNKKMMKKRLKLVKGLSNDLAMLLSSGLLLDPLLQEASEALLSQLKKLQSEQKELKKATKGEKAKCEATVSCTSTTSSSSSSSSSSESSDSECGTEVLDKSHQKCETYALPPSSMTINDDDLQPQPLPPVIQHKEAPTLASLTSARKQERPITPSAAAVVEEYTLRKSEEDNNNILLSLLEKDEEKEEDMEKNKIEVCMGGKCKKSGAGALLEEFQKVVGATAPAVDVVGCKCMGKCRDGPNVRLVSSSLCNDGYVHDELPHHRQVAVAAATAAVAVAGSSSVVTRRRTPKPSYPLCIGVGLKDVGAIVSKLAGDRVAL